MRPELYTVANGFLRALAVGIRRGRVTGDVESAERHDTGPWPGSSVDRLGPGKLTTALDFAAVSSVAPDFDRGPCAMSYNSSTAVRRRVRYWRHPRSVRSGAGTDGQRGRIVYADESNTLSRSICRVDCRIPSSSSSRETRYRRGPLDRRRFPRAIDTSFTTRTRGAASSRTVGNWPAYGKGVRIVRRTCQRPATMSRLMCADRGVRVRGSHCSPIVSSYFRLITTICLAFLCEPDRTPQHRPRT